jgi:hypothetical protein
MPLRPWSHQCAHHFHSQVLSRSNLREELLRCRRFLVLWNNLPRLAGDRKFIKLGPWPLLWTRLFSWRLFFNLLH